MENIAEDVKRAEFRDVLRDLSQSQDSLKTDEDRVAFYKRLEGIYHSDFKETRFRHFYSDIFSVLEGVVKKN